ncbi:putative ribonuclease H-like domain-containing protein, partial [Tanacetum coccineum]
VLYDFKHSLVLKLNVGIKNKNRVNNVTTVGLKAVVSAAKENGENIVRKAKRTTEISQSSGPIPLVTNETVIKEWEDRMERATTTASSLEAEPDSGNINRTQSMETLNESFPQGADSGSGLKCQDTILGGAEAQTRFEAASKQSNDPPLSRVNTLGSMEDSIKLKELMEFCTQLSEFIQALVEKKKVTITETSIRSDLKLDDAEGIDCLPNATIFAELERMGWKEAMQDELLQFRLQKVWRLVDLPKGKHAMWEKTKWVYRNKKDERGIVVRNKAILVAQGYTQEEGIVVANSTTEAEYVAAANCCGQGTDSNSGPRCQDTILGGAEAQNSSVQYALTVNPTIYTTCIEQFWTSAKAKTVNGERQIQALVDKKKLSIEEKSKLFVELLEKRKKHFAALRAQEKRSKLPTKAQKRNIMSTNLKNMAGYKHNQLKSKSYDEIQEMFDKEMKKHIEIVKDDEVAIDAIPLATKPPVIVKYKIVKEGKFIYIQLIRADGS